MPPWYKWGQATLSLCWDETPLRQRTDLTERWLWGDDGWNGPNEHGARQSWLRRSTDAERKLLVQLLTNDPSLTLDEVRSTVEAVLS